MAFEEPISCILCRVGPTPVLELGCSGFSQEREIPLPEEEGRESMMKSQNCTITNHYKWRA